MRLLILTTLNILSFASYDTTQVPISASSICPDIASQCVCQKPNLEYYITCEGLQDLDSFLDILKSSFINETIARLIITFSNITSISDDDFRGINMKSIYIENSTVNSISEHAFAGSVKLGEIYFENVMNMESIPISVNDVPLKFFHLCKGILNYVGTELQNISTLYVLELYQNEISYIHPEAFLNCINLERIDLSHNQIQHLSEHIFQNNLALYDVSLKHNQLVSLKGVLTPCAPKLRKLSIMNNTLTNVNEIMPIPAPNLKLLYLSNNPLENLTADDFAKNFYNLNTLLLANTSLVNIENNTFNGLPHLTYLVLGHNELTELPESIFDYLESLDTLYLNHNQLTNVYGLFNKIKKLRQLYLSSNRISNITKVFDSLTHLQELNLNKNLIEEIPEGTFASMPEVKYITFKGNKIQNLHKQAFTGLKGLSVLDLCNNSIVSLGGAFSDENVLRHVDTLLLDNNQLTSVTREDFNLPNLQFLSLMRNNVSNLQDAFKTLTTLKRLYLAGNNLETITEDNFPDEIELRELYLHGNPLYCDCRLLWIVSRFKLLKSIQLDNAECHGPSWLRRKLLRNLKTRMIIRWKSDCPLACHPCLCHSSGINVSVSVHCDHLNFTYVPIVYPAETTSVDLSFNFITSLPSDFSKRVPNLVDLDIRHNLLTSLENVSLPFGLKKLYVSQNRLTRFPSKTFFGINMSEVSFSNNPWMCDCPADHFRIWLLKNSRTILDLNETCCANSSENGRLRGKEITKLVQIDLCPLQIALYAAVAIGILAFLFTAASSFIGYIKYKMPLKVWLYSRGLCLRWVKEEDMDEEKCFDAFVAFSKDENCVGQLVKELEEKEPFYKLCIHYRDFLAGVDIYDNIVRAVNSSKKTLVLLSRNFLESTWAVQEFTEAHRQMLEERTNCIILVLVGDIPPSEEISNIDIRTYMQKAVYLRWEERYFWEKLRYAMPKHPVPRNTESQVSTKWNESESEPLVNEQ